MFNIYLKFDYNNYPIYLLVEVVLLKTASELNKHLHTFYV